MSSYLICDVSVKNRDQLNEYLRLSQDTLEPYGGKFLAQAGMVQVMEGDWKPNVIIIAEFPSAKDANAWYESAEYAPALKVKPLAIDRNMILVKGKDED